MKRAMLIKRKVEILDIKGAGAIIKLWVEGKKVSFFSHEGTSRIRKCSYPKGVCSCYLIG